MFHNSLTVSGVASIGENRELGVNNKLLWYLPEDLKRFKEITSGHPIIMGRKTFESIGRILPNRTNIIITQNKEFSVEGGVVVHSLQEALEVGSRGLGVGNKEKQNTNNSEFIIHNSLEKEVFVIGGGQIFKEALPLLDRLYLTVVHTSFPNADTFFPDYSSFTKVIEKKEGKSDNFSYTYLTLEK